jgi:hypothetical protein
VGENVMLRHDTVPLDSYFQNGDTLTFGSFSIASVGLEDKCRIRLLLDIVLVK